MNDAIYHSAEDQPEDVMLANIARACFPELAAARLKEVEGEREKFMTVLPIFYCASVGHVVLVVVERKVVRFPDPTAYCSVSAPCRVGWCILRGQVVTLSLR